MTGWWIFVFVIGAAMYIRYEKEVRKFLKEATIKEVVSRVLLGLVVVAVLTAMYSLVKWIFSFGWPIAVIIVIAIVIAVRKNKNK